MATTTNLTTLKINYLTQAQYDTAISNNQINSNELYLTPASGVDTAGTGLSKSGTTINHSNSVTAGTAGTSSATSGSTLAVPYITYDAQGHITATGTHTHTVSGFLTSSSTLDATKLSGTIPTSCYTDNDEKLKTAALTSGTTYYPILATGANAAANRQVDSTLGGLKYISTAGTTSTVGTAVLQVGNGTAKGTANNEQGVLRVYGTTAYYCDIKTETDIPAANRTIYLPSYGGAMYLTCTSTTNAVGGATTAPVYVDNTGRIQAVTSIPYSLIADPPTIPTVTDTKVTQSATTTSDWRKVLVHYTTNTSGGDVPASVTNQVYAAKGIEVQPSTGTLHAEALTTKKVTSLITGGSETAAVTTSPYKPALWKFNAGIAPADGNIVVIQAPGGGHSYGEFLSLDNGTTYKPITHSGTGKMTTHYASGSPIALIYDSDWTATSMYPLAGGTSTGTITGGAWRVINGYLDGNTYTQCYCSTAAATAAKVGTMSNYVATANRYVMINIVYANTSATAITMNINGTGAKPIYINGSASSTSNYTLPAGSYLVYYNGTNYYFRTDGKIDATKLTGTIPSSCLPVYDGGVS